VKLTPETAARPTWAERVVDLLHRRARWLIPLTLLAAFGLGVGARTIKVDNSLEVWFVEGDPALVAYDEYKQAFGNDETIVVAAVAPEGIYTPAALERIRTASKRLEAHPKVRRVTSIALGLHVSGSEGAVDVDPLLGDDPITQQDADDLRKKLAANPFFRGTIVGDSDTITLILVDPKSSPDFERERAGILKDVRAIADQELARDGGATHLGGIGVVYEGLNQASLRDSGIFVTLSYIIIFFGLWLLFRRWIWVAVGVLVVTAANVATLGIAGFAGRDMNMVTAVLPTLIMTIGILDLVHLVDSYEEEGAGKRRLATVMALVVVPCIFNTFTDVIGFASLVSAEMSAVRDLGWLASVGLVLLLVIILVVAIPAVARFGGRGAKAKAPTEESGWLRRMILFLLGLATHRRLAVYAAALALAAASAVGITRLDVDTYTIGFLDEDNPVRRDHDAIEARFGRYIPLEMRVTTPAENGLKDPAVLRQLDDMERAFEKVPDVARATGLPEVVKRVNQVWSEERPGTYAIPAEQGIVAEQLLTYSFDTDGRDHLDDLVTTADYRTTHVTSRTGLPSARGIKRIIDDLQAAGDASVKAPVTVEPAGYLPLYVRIIQHITNTQVRSFLLAFGMVALIMIILLRSVRLGLLSMIPNVLPAAMTLGLMGFLEIRLDVATVLIAAIAMGISVNDTSHIMFRFKHELAATPADAEGAVRRMMLGTGRPVIAASLILTAGFAVLLFASVKSVYYFGVLSAATTISALFADLILTPALLLSMARRKLL
jgi:predicted RND superfamily exporter protein